MKLFLASTLIVGSLFLTVPAGAQGTSTAPVPGSAATAPGAKPTGSKTSSMPGVQTAKSKDCSVQADKQGLHGKARKAFRNKCKHA